MADDKENSILYELLVHNEWILEQGIKENEVQMQDGPTLYDAFGTLPSKLLYSASSFFRSSVSVWNSTKILNNCADWQLGVGADGAVIAILQDTSLEIRVKKDEYLSVVGKNSNLDFDPYQAWRRVCWSPECSMVAVGFSNGVVEIFNTVGTSLFTIFPPRFKEQKKLQDVSNALAGLFFSTIRTGTLKWSAEMILVDFQGQIRSYYVSPTEGYQENHFSSFSRLYHSGISAVTMLGSLFIVAGSTKYSRDPKLRNNGLGHGLSLWRVTDEYPFYIQVPTVDEDEYILPREGIFGNWFSEKVPIDSIFRLSASPLGRQVVALHASGSISVWDIPSLRKRRFWLLEDQPNYDAANTLSLGRTLPPLRQAPISIRNHLTDVKWWNETSVILTRMSGAVAICSVFTLKNLLGDSPEFFEGVPQISDVNDRGFLALEMEVHANDYDEAVEDEQSKVESTAKALGKTIYGFMLNWVIGAEETPELTVPVNNSRTFRLLSLKSTTPQELYERKIQVEEYGEALALARKYELDCDLVYQRQWHSNPVTVVSIQDYLYKVKKRSWVIHECLTRIPEDFEAARELLLYGLRGTELDTIVAIAKGTNVDEFIASELSIEFEEDLDDDAEEAERRAKEWIAEDLKKRTELLSQIDFKNLSQEQIEIIKARQKLLRYFDRLGTYEILQGLGEIVVEKFDHEFYKGIRELNALDTCVKFARNGNSRGVDVLFMYHNEETVPHRLAILSNFPPMVCPYEYKDLLPECDLSGLVFEGEVEVFRDADWCEDEIFMKATGTYEEDPASYLYENHPYLGSFKGKPLTGDLVKDWYKVRAREIERESHFVDVALDLIKLGRERNVLGLEPLLRLLDSLEILNYEVGLSSLTLDQLESMNDLERLKLFMSATDSSNFIENLRLWGIPFLEQLEKSNPGARSILLKEYIVSISDDDLSYTLKAIQNSQGEPDECILCSPEDILNVAINSIYYCSKANQLPRAFAILSNLPLKDTKTGSSALLSLHDEIDVLEDYLVVAEILSNYKILVTPSELKKIQQDQTQSKQMIVKLAMSCVNREKGMKPKDWRKLIQECMEIRQKVFFNIESITCYEIITNAMLASGISEYIDGSREFMETKARNSKELHKVPHKSAIALVLSAAREYFNCSNSYDDESMQLARHCLRLIETDHIEILEELDLISSLSILPDFGVHKLPLQVRMCDDKISLIKEALEVSPDNYLLGSRLLHLSKLLCICGQNNKAREVKILSLIVEYALKARDFSSASVWCDQLMSEGHSEAWPICATLGQCEQYTDLKFRAKLLDFAMTYSNIEQLEELIRSRLEVDLRSLYVEARVQMQPAEHSLGSDDEFEDAKSIQTEESFDEHPNTDDQNATIRTLLETPFGLTKGLISATAMTTSKLTSSVTSKKFWKAASAWVQPLSEATGKLTSHESPKKSNSALEVPKCHAFYQDIWPSAETSSIGASYSSYASRSIHSSGIIPFNLLRIALIEQTLTDDYTSIDNQVIHELGKLLLPEDLLLGLSFLLSVPNPNDVDQIFASLPQTELCLQLSLYYNCLQLYSRRYTSTEGKLASFYCMDPYELMAHPFDKTPETVHHLDNLQRIQKILNQFIEGKSLEHLGTMVDIKRFLIDEDYKLDTVLGLAMTSEDNVLEYSLELAEKYAVPQWEVIATHIQYLFDSNDSVEHIKRTFEKRKVHVNENKVDFIKFLKNKVYITLDGYNYDKLYLYYSFISEFSDDNVDTFLDILVYLTDKQQRIDFKTLLECMDDYIQKIVNEDNVNIISEVIQMLGTFGSSVTGCSFPYFCLAQKNFFHYEEIGKPKTKEAWMNRYEIAMKFKDHLTNEDHVNLIRYFTLSSKSLEIPLNIRISMINQTLEHMKNLPETNAQISVINNIRDHLSSINKETFDKLLSNPILKEYLIEFQLSEGDESILCELSKKVLLNCSNMNILRELIMIYPESIMPCPEDVFLEVFNDTIELLKNDDNNDSSLPIMENLVKELQTMDNFNDILDEDDILKEIRSFVTQNEYSLSNRISLLSLAIQYLNTDDNDTKYVQSLKTGGILQQAFGDDEHSDVDNKILFNKLYNSLSTYDQAKSLYELLVVWSPFDDKFYENSTNPWKKLALKTLECGKTSDIYNLINDISIYSHKNSQIPDEAVLEIFDHIKVPCKPTAMKLAYRHCLEPCINAFKNSTIDFQMNDELLDLILSNNNIIHTLNHSYYGKLVEYILEKNDTELIQNVIDLLRSNNKFIEASSLEVQLSSMPESLKTISNVLLHSFGKFL